MLVVVARDGTSPAGKAKWKCTCDCGASASVIGQNLRTGLTRSCGAHKGELVPLNAAQPELYRIAAIDGPKLGIQPTSYGFCEVWEVDTNVLLFRNEPVSRIETTGSPSANAHRGMTWLVQHGMIEAKRNQTWRQWLIAARVVVDIKQIGDAEAVNGAWEIAAGRRLHGNRHTVHPSFQPAMADIPDITPAQKFELDKLLESFATDDGADHMERYPISAEAKAQIELQAARRGGQLELMAVRQRARKASTEE